MSDDFMKSTEQLLDMYEKLGVPHFQRGLVWSNSAVALLLESLYHGTPCGTVVLWEPIAPGTQGIPLASGKEPTYMIVDGQQRIRNLHDVFRKKKVEGVQDENNEAGERHADTWCLNLARLPSTRQAGATPPQEESFSLFRFIRDPLEVKAEAEARKKKGRRGQTKWERLAVPLALFLEESTEELLAYLEKLEVKEPYAAAARDRKLGERVREMLTKPAFCVRYIREDSTSGGLPDIISVYDRINSAGKRVEKEEKAFAALVPVVPGVSQTLVEFFRIAHPQKPLVEAASAADEGSGLKERDDALSRARERQFGFGLFVRTLIQVSLYHCNVSLGRNAFAYDAIKRHRLLSRLEGNEEAADKLMKATMKILAFIRDVLAKELCCDDLRTLPDATSLWPVVQMLTRYPQLMERAGDAHARAAVASLLLRLLISDHNDKELLDYVRTVNGSRSAQECYAALDKEIRVSSSKVDRRLRNAQSLQNRFVLLLYWVLRKRKARDFSYTANLTPKAGNGQPGGGAEVERPLSGEVCAEKQHIVPYSILREVFHIKEASRLGTHIANSIGNLTYISRSLNGFRGWNGFERGLGDEPVDLDREPEDNRKAHLLGGKEGIRLRQLYREACEQKPGAEEDEAAERRKAKKAYKKFVAKRVGLIHDALMEWVEELDGDRFCAGAPRIEPAKRVFPLWSDRIRGLAYPNVVADALIELIPHAEEGGESREGEGESEADGVDPIRWTVSLRCFLQ